MAYLIKEGKQYWIGVSTEAKPAEARPGSEFYEENTGDLYVYSGTAWVKKKYEGVSLPEGAATAAKQDEVIEALKYSVEANIDTGKASENGTTTTLKDDTKNFQANIWNNALIEIDRDGTHYIRKVTSHTADEITFPDIGSAVQEGDNYWLKIPVEIADIERVGGTVQTGADWTPLLQAAATAGESTVEIDGTTYQVSGGNTLRGTDGIKPTAVLAHAAIPYCYYFAIDTGVVEATDGTSWVVI